MQCLECGAYLADRTQPCLFCGERLSPMRIPMERRGAILAAALVFLALSMHSIRCIAYSPQVELRRGTCAAAVGPLAEGKTTRVRSVLSAAYYKLPYSGLPGAMIAASYYRDYMTGGATSDLDKARSYSKAALRKEANFVVHYYRALIHYEDGEYDDVYQQLDLAVNDLKGGFNPWGAVVHRRRWFENFGTLRLAADEAEKSLVKPKAYYPRLDAMPEVPCFKAEFGI